MAKTLVEVLIASVSDRPNFVIDTGVNEVPIVMDDAIGVLVDAFGYPLFQRMDSVTILDMGIFLPYQFGLGQEPVNMELVWIAESGVGTGIVARSWIPGACSVSFAGGASQGQFVPFPALESPLAWPDMAKLALRVYGGKVSMINVPEGLSGTMYAVPWVRVQHNLELMPEGS